MPEMKNGFTTGVKPFDERLKIAGLVVAAAAASILVLVIVVAIAAALTAFLVAATAAGAGRLGAHGALAGFLNFFRSGRAAKVNGHAQIMIDGIQEFINGLAGFQKATGRIILDHIFTQGVELGDFLFSGGHAGQVLVAQFFAVGVYFFKKLGRLWVLEKKADFGLGGHNLVFLGKQVAKGFRGGAQVVIENGGIHISIIQPCLP